MELGGVASRGQVADTAHNDVGEGDDAGSTDKPVEGVRDKGGFADAGTGGSAVGGEGTVVAEEGDADRIKDDVREKNNRKANKGVS